MIKRTIAALGLLLATGAGFQPFQAASVATPGVEITLLDSTLNLPIALAFAPDGRLFIGEQAGVIKIFKNGAMNASPYITLSPIDTGSEAGLLGLCLDPNFDSNGYLYAFVTRGSGIQQIVRYTSVGDTGTDPTLIVDNIPSTGDYHNGGGIGFGPDGYLYAVVGDNDVASDAQVSASWRGKVLRFNAATSPASIPDSNPIAGSAVYSIGHRHPFRLTFRPGTDALYVSENGPSQDDEINVITPGANYGWPNDTGPNTNGAYTNPIFTFTETIAVTDMLFYTGSTLPYAGDLFFVDYKFGRIRRFEMDASSETVASGPYDFITGIGEPVDIAQGPDGAIYYCGRYLGELYKAQVATPLTVTQVDPAPQSQTTSVPAALTLTFSTAVDAATASSLNISLTRAGPDTAFDTADDMTVTPNAISASGTTVTVDLSGSSLPPDSYRIRVSGTDVPPSAHAGLFAHWNCDEGTGTSAADASGLGHDGTLNGIEWSTGIFGKALRFDGDAARVDIGAGGVGSVWTVSLWVHRTGNAFGAASLMDAYAPSSDTSLRLEQGNDVGYTEYGVEDYGTGYVAPIGSWVHLAITNDGLNTRLYVNGVLSDLAWRSFDLTVDTLGSAISTRTRSPLGLLDEIQIYTRVLTVDEIASLAVPSGGFRGAARQLLDGDFSDTFPSGDGAEGGDFSSTFTILEPPAPPIPGEPGDGGDSGCGLLAVEGPLMWAAILIIRRRRRT